MLNGGDDIDVGPENHAFRDSIRRFLDENLPDELRAGTLATTTVFAEPEIGREWQRILYEKGWLAFNWPVDFGGTGWTPVERYIFEKECALANAPRLPGLGLKLLGPVLFSYGTPAQHQKYLPKILSAEHYWCQGFSEPGSGSDLASLKTRAVKVGDHYIVNGSKTWTTHGHLADHMFCLARTDTSAKAQRGISFLLIDMNQPGVQVRPIITLAGDHEVNEVFLQDVKVHESDLVGEEGAGWTIAKFLLENERGGSCFAPKLLADISHLWADAASEPSGNAHSLAEDPLFCASLARLELEALGLEVTELRILEQLRLGQRPGPQSSIVKLMASDLRQRIDALAMRTFGYIGLQLETRRPLYGKNSPDPIYRKEAQVASASYLNAQAWTIFGGSNEIQRSIIAKTVLMI
jgi:alkylation response protein AidB-like acyl-CoA dehydrogenase